MIRKISLSLLMVWGLALPIQAATITYGPTSFGAFIAGTAGSFNVPQFDPSLGTLTQIDLLVSGMSTGGTNSIENLGVTAGSADLSIGTNITVSGPSSFVVLTTPATSVTGIPLAAFDGVLDFAGASGFTLAGGSSSDSDSNSLFSGFAPYLGLGNVGFNFSSAGNTANNLTNVSPSSSTSTPATFGFDATVTYTYTPVPEPSTMALAGIGLSGVLVTAYRRRRTAK